MKTSEIPETPILEFLAKHQGRWCTHDEGYGHMPTVRDAMPEGTPRKLHLAKMRALLKRGLVHGCGCGCRGDWEITNYGLAKIGQRRTERGVSVGFVSYIEDVIVPAGKAAVDATFNVEYQDDTPFAAARVLAVENEGVVDRLRIELTADSYAEFNAVAWAVMAQLGGVQLKRGEQPEAH